jgi:hypothetical protein
MGMVTATGGARAYKRRTYTWSISDVVSSRAAYQRCNKAGNTYIITEFCWTTCMKDPARVAVLERAVVNGVLCDTSGLDEDALRACYTGGLKILSNGMPLLKLEFSMNPSKGAFLKLRSTSSHLNCVSFRMVFFPPKAPEVRI